jgi:hypothetical protein
MTYLERRRRGAWRPTRASRCSTDGDPGWGGVSDDRDPVGRGGSAAGGCIRAGYNRWCLDFVGGHPNGSIRWRTWRCTTRSWRWRR